MRKVKVQLGIPLNKHLKKHVNWSSWWSVGDSKNMGTSILSKPIQKALAKIPFALLFLQLLDICFRRKSGSFLQLLVGNCWSFSFVCVETIHVWPQRPPILVRLPTRMYIGSIGFTPSSSHHQITTLLVGDPYTAHTPLHHLYFLIARAELSINTWRSKKTQQNKQNFWHSTLCSK